MYWVPIVVLLLIAAIAVGWSPIFAMIVAGVLFALFLAYVSLRPRADERIEPPTGSAEEHQDETPTGAWGERRP